MPSKKKKYNARFPAGRIKKIMQTDEEVGKVAQAVPVIISKALEMFIESLLKKSTEITQNRNAKTLTPSHMKQCILSESRFDFLKDLVKCVPDASVQEDDENNALAETNANFGIIPEESAESNVTTPDDKKDQIEATLHFVVPPANFYTEQLNNTPTTSSTSTSTSETPLTKQKGRPHQHREPRKRNSTDKSTTNNSTSKNPGRTRKIRRLTSSSSTSSQHESSSSGIVESTIISDGQLLPAQGGNGDSLCIDEDYDN